MIVRTISLLPFLHDGLLLAALDSQRSFSTYWSRGWYGNQLDHRQTKPRPPPKAPTPAPKPTPRWPLGVLLGRAVLAGVLLFHPGFGSATTRTSTTAASSAVTATGSRRRRSGSTGVVTGYCITAWPTSQIPTALNDQALSPLLLKHQVSEMGRRRFATSVASLLLDLLPLLLIVGAFIWFSHARPHKHANRQIMTLRPEVEAKLYDEERPTRPVSRTSCGYGTGFPQAEVAGSRLPDLGNCPSATPMRVRSGPRAYSWSGRPGGREDADGQGGGRGEATVSRSSAQRVESGAKTFPPGCCRRRGGIRVQVNEDARRACSLDHHRR